MPMKVVKPFRYRHVDNSIEHFQPGQVLPKELEGVAYAVAHTDKAPPPNYPKGSAAFEREARRRVMLEMEKARDARVEEGPFPVTDKGEGANKGEGDDKGSESLPQPRARARSKDA